MQNRAQSPKSPHPYLLAVNRFAVYYTASKHRLHANIRLHFKKTINPKNMGIDDEPSSIETDLEKFAADLSDAGNFVEEYRARTSLHDLPSFNDLVGHEEEMMATLFEHFGIEPDSSRVVREYSMPGTSRNPGEGEIKVKVIATNDPQIFLGKYIYADGEIDWAIRPLEGDE